ncbi:promiscuous sugar phosphatase YidA, haloacid dehalogenase-like phosphatase family [Lentilactobacillus farraginis DSM 18382 = JCM 14108]|nr:promiscuous sugar phosphatase YidA, haloacid dehalogenase-like phosphatase family [Lentilactobacillus farraginis DSM 18382 = JCM 14108]
MAIGDQGNDLTMIEYAGTGVAMGNAIDEVKAAATVITKPNSEDGVAYAINKWAL